MNTPIVFKPGHKPGSPDPRRLAEQETEEILALRDTERVLYVKRGFKTFHFDWAEHWKHMGCASLNDWAERHDFTPSTVHSGVNAIDVYHYFFDADLDLMAKVGQKKMDLILPIANQLRENALLYASSDPALMVEKYQEAQEMALIWLGRAAEESYTALKEAKNGAGGSEWVKLASREDKKDDLYFVWDADDQGNPIRRERTVRELFELFPEVDDLDDETVMRLNVYGPKKNEVVTPPLEEPRHDDRRGCPNCSSPRVGHNYAKDQALCHQCGLRWNPQTGEVFNADVIPVRDSDFRGAHSGDHRPGD